MDRLFASNLLEAELRATCAREGVQFDPGLLSGMNWILPNRPLGAELARVVSVGYLRGADLWHLACAVYLDPTVEEISFLTLDGRQRDVAERLGFRT